MTLEQARNRVRKETFGTDAWESAMQVVRNMVAAETDRAPKEEFCSVDSGWHRTRLTNGRIIG